MIIYLTYNEAPSGIFSSQVIDVVKFLNQNFDVKVKLFSIISIRGYLANRGKIKRELPDAVVLPMVPKMQNWRLNKFLLLLVCFIYKPKKIIARSVMATQLALLMREKNKNIRVVYDGRGAIAAEWEEYKVIANEDLLSKITIYESEAILNSNYRIAVSNALVHFWKKKYSYNNLQHVIIPCTLNTDFEKIELTKKCISEKRKELGLHNEDCVFIYSGSVAGWQSFELLNAFIEPILKSNSLNKILFFSPTDSNIVQLQQLFPKQVFCKHLSSNQVSKYLLVGDYGLLIREESVTNLVASPVKYAEYLACGLKVIISNNLGDYSALSLSKNWGFVFNQTNTLNKLNIEEKKKISKEAVLFFSKQTYKVQYQQLISA